VVVSGDASQTSSATSWAPPDQSLVCLLEPHHGQVASVEYGEPEAMTPSLRLVVVMAITDGWLWGKVTSRNLSHRSDYRKLNNIVGHAWAASTLPRLPAIVFKPANLLVGFDSLTLATGSDVLEQRARAGTPYGNPAYQWLRERHARNRRRSRGPYNFNANTCYGNGVTPGRHQPGPEP